MCIMPPELLTMSWSLWYVLLSYTQSKRSRNLHALRLFDEVQAQKRELRHGLIADVLDLIDRARPRRARFRRGGHALSVTHRCRYARCLQAAELSLGATSSHRSWMSLWWGTRGKKRNEAVERIGVPPNSKSLIRRDRGSPMLDPIPSKAAASFCI